MLFVNSITNRTVVFVGSFPPFVQDFVVEFVRLVSAISGDVVDVIVLYIQEFSCDHLHIVHLDFPC